MPQDREPPYAVDLEDSLLLCAGSMITWYIVYNGEERLLKTYDVTLGSANTVYNNTVKYAYEVRRRHLQIVREAIHDSQG